MGRIRLMEKNKKEREKKTMKRRNSLLGQFVTSNLSATAD